MKLVKSPLNYTGNKYRIMEQINKYFPEKIDCMVDLFCGGATVGLNTNAKKVIFVDNNEKMYVDNEYKIIPSIIHVGGSIRLPLLTLSNKKPIDIIKKQ